MGAYRRKLKKGERWWFKGQYKSIQYHSKAIYLTKTEAKNAEADKIKEIDQKLRSGDLNDMNLLNLVNLRLDYLLEHKSKDYYKENQRYLKKLIAYFGSEIMVSAVRKKDIGNLLDSEAKRLKKAGKTYEKANAMLRSYKALFYWAERKKDIDIKNPCTGLDMYSINNTDKYIPDDSQIMRIYENLTPKMRFLFDFVKDTGCRISEAIRLDFSHIRENSIVLYTRKAKNSNLTARIVPKPSCLNGITGKGRVFKDWTAYPRFLEDAVKEANQKKWNWHSLRHRYASILASEGRPLIEIMQLLGHSNISTTQRYLKFLGFNYF